ncbi:MAG: UDP-N-acetylglucosamine 4,6-dehydratase (inverting) [Candidatus Omnitrophota bacterium]|nr:MAG: UDP-N-acetylglucosamine 4,6-dehydratase (inverting) [Candidatus Omnitrophota bacterium]
MLDNKTILITGGTGSFGKKFTEIAFKDYKPKKIIIFSRDEFKQHKMAKKFPTSKFNIRYFIGDVRDRERLERAFENIDYVIHAAALKQVPALEYNPIEAVKTNILGANNIVNAALDKGIEKVIALSSDKAVNPVNLYGATKLVAEKIFVDANAYGGNRVRFSVVRYGNVLGSRGSVIEHFLNLKSKNIKEFPITDLEMTRFWMTLDESAKLVIRALQETAGGEIFIPNIPSMKLVDLAKATVPDCTFKVIGVRPGEKIHESLISSDESRNTKIFNGLYVILPPFFHTNVIPKKYEKFSSVPKNFIFRSDTNDRWLTVEEVRKMISGETKAAEVKECLKTPLN